MTDTRLDPSLRHLGEQQLFIDGEFAPAAAGTTYENLSPRTAGVLGRTADAGAEDVHRAVRAARHAFDETTWSTDGAFRARCLGQLHDALSDARPLMSEVLVHEAGVPVALLDGPQFQTPVDNIPYWADLAGSYRFRQLMPRRTTFGREVDRLMVRRGAGVVAAITAWNYPLTLNLLKLMPALAAGCTMVLKPAPQTPWAATVLSRLIAEHTDIPPGVVNVVPSSDPEVGRLLSESPGVDMVTFVGSTAVGKLVQAQTAGSVKRILLELGGKSANIVLDDAELDVALPAAAVSSCTHAGQGCGLLTRLLLPASRYDEGVQILENVMSGMRCGDPLDPATVTGPVISAAQLESVLGHISRAEDDGAKLVTGGRRAATPAEGYYVEPTLFVDVDPDSALAQEEVFGPVLAVSRYEDDEDAVRLANHSRYGLTGAVQSTSPERALDVASRITAGCIAVAGAHWMAPDTPFGGFKESGNGREGGIEGLEAYLETTVISAPAEWSIAEHVDQTSTQPAS